MEPGGSLPHSQEPATCPYPESAPSSPCPHTTSQWPILILSSHLRLVLASGILPSGLPTKSLYAPIRSPIRATCPAHLILLDLITRTTFGDEYRSLSSSLCSLLHFPVTSKQNPAHHLHHRVAQEASRLQCVRSICCGALHHKRNPRKLIIQLTKFYLVFMTCWIPFFTANMIRLLRIIASEHQKCVFSNKHMTRMWERKDKIHLLYIIHLHALLLIFIIKTN
jgi:hypothetical protein